MRKRAAIWRIILRRRSMRRINLRRTIERQKSVCRIIRLYKDMRWRIMRRMIPPLAMVGVLLAAGGCGDVPVSEGEAIERLLTAPDPGSRTGTGEAEREKTVLRLWSFHQSKEYEFWKRLAQRYRDVNPDVEVQVEYVSSDIYFNSSRLLTFFASGHGPDIFFVSPGTIAKFAEAQVLQPLSDRFSEEIRNDFYPSALEAVMIDDDIVAIPIETELLALYYNKEKFADAGLEPPATWDDLLNAARRLNSEAASSLTMETFASVYQTFTWLPFLWQTGTDFMAEDGSYRPVDPDRALRMFGFFRQMLDEDLINRHPSRPTNDIGILADGETVMQVSGSWSIAMLETVYRDKAIGVVPLPHPREGEPLTIAGGWKIAANRFSEHVREAADFIMWAFAGDPEIPIEWCNEVKFAYSPRISVMEKAGGFYLKGMREVFTTRIFGTERQEPRFPQELNAIFSDALLQLIHTDRPAADIVDEMNARVLSFLSSIEK